MAKRKMIVLDWVKKFEKEYKLIVEDECNFKFINIKTGKDWDGDEGGDGIEEMGDGTFKMVQFFSDKKLFKELDLDMDEGDLLSLLVNVPQEIVDNEFEGECPVEIETVELSTDEELVILYDRQKTKGKGK